jgi:hypothetical protein
MRRLPVAWRDLGKWLECISKPPTRLGYEEAPEFFSPLCARKGDSRETMINVKPLD